MITFVPYSKPYQPSDHQTIKKASMVPIMPKPYKLELMQAQTPCCLTL